MLKDAYPYFIFDRQAEEAMNFYAEVLQATVLDLTRYKEMPSMEDQQPVPDDVKELVMNGTIQLPNGTYIMFSDNYPGAPYTIGNNITVTLVYTDPEDTQKVFDVLKENGHIEMELQETFWSPLYGNVTDKYGVQWQLSTETEES